MEKSIEVPAGRSATVSLSQLVPAPDHNVRIFGKYNEITQLAANIQRLGLIHPIAVRFMPGHDGESPTGQYMIIDGERRYAALRKLQESGVIDDGFIVPVLLRDADDATASAISLSANIMRLPLHPADQHAAFAQLQSQGRSVQEIGKLFSLKPKQVEKVIALGNLAPEVLEAYRKSETMTEEITQLLTRCTQDEQRKFLPAILKGKMRAWELKSRLEQDQVPVTAPLAKFVGLEAYQAAGGQVVSDLFGGVEQLSSVQLLVDLAKKKTTDLKQQLIDEGWKWVALEKDMPEGYRHKWDRTRQRDAFGSPEDEKRWGDIQARKREIDGIEEKQEEETNHQLDVEYQALEDEEDEIRRRFVASYSKSDKAKSGVVVNFKPQLVNEFITYGWVNPADAKAEKTAERKKEKARNPGEKKLNDSSLSNALTSDLHTVMMEATMLAIGRDPSAAYVLATLAMLANFATKIDSDVAIRPAARGPNQEYKHQQAHLKKVILDCGISGKDTHATYTALAHLTPKRLATLHAALVASQLEDCDFVPKILPVNPSEIFKADVSFFSRLNRGQMFVAFKEAGVSLPPSEMKKSELVEFAARELGKVGWLPIELRTSEYKGPASKLTKKTSKKAA